MGSNLSTEISSILGSLWTSLMNFEGEGQKYFCLAYQKGSTLKGKNFLLRSKFFPFRVGPFFQSDSIYTNANRKSLSTLFDRVATHFLFQNSLTFQ